ncbi:hypothetical protein GCM10010124_34380 [Pilimelia terevasa]|uniref:DUF350 domain-containing protein n=1 Tax=Pilimelia terevasa TaxID=53372 RepID=A0A8J3FJB4_9ACTN|nr:DUF350 domain-containing protein [Pilimelia terevasa]GGK38698.1 hypothetical protein GCM10010124_34380 [Pilimelia terevasa]
MFLATLADYAGNLGHAALILLVVAVSVGGGWHLLNLLTRVDDNDELFVRGNGAYLAQRLGISVAQVVGLLPAIGHYDPTRWRTSAWWLVAECAFVLAAVLLARPVVDWLVLPAVRNATLLREGSLAVGITEAGFYLATGFVVNGALSGGADSLALALASTAGFFVLGLALVAGVFWLHEWVTPYHLRDRIAQGSVPAAVEVAGVLTALGIVVREGVAGDFDTWGASLARFAATVVLAVAVLYAFRWLIDRLVLRGHTVRATQNADHLVAACLLAGLLVGAAFAVAEVVGTQL